MQTVDQVYLDIDSIAQAIIGAVTEAVFVLDPSGVIVAANSQAANQFERTRSDSLKGENYYALAPQSVVEARQEQFKHAVESGLPHCFEDESKSRVWTHSINPIQDRNKTVVALALYTTDVTDFRRTDQELRRERQRQIYMMEALPGFVCLLGRHHEIRYANRYFKRYFGKPKGRKCHELLRGENAPCTVCPTLHAKKTERLVEWEWTDPAGRTFHIHSHPMTDFDGEPVVLVLGIDISQRKSAENALQHAHDKLELRVEERTAELQQSESRYRAIVEDQSELICRFTSLRLITFVNKAYCRFFSKEKNELLGSVFSPKFLSDDQKKFNTQLRALRPDTPTSSGLFRVHTSDGQLHWLFCTIRAIFNEHGMPSEYQAVAKDITRRKEVERRYYDLIQSLPVVIFSMRRSFQFEFINNTCATLLGYAPEEAMESPTWFLEHVHKEDKQKLKQKLQKCFDHPGHALSENVRFEHKKGYELHLNIQTIELPRHTVPSTHERNTGNDEALIEGIILDVTERAFLDKVLVQKERIETLGAMSEEIAHEFRNPIQIVGAFAKRLHTTHPDLDEAEIIFEESMRLEQLVNRVTEYLNPVAATRSECSVNVLLQFCVDLLATSLERVRLRCALQLAPMLTAVMSDPDILTQVFINLINSAAEGMDHGGEIRIQTYATQQHVCVDISTPNGGAEYSDPTHGFLPFEKDQRNYDLAVSYRLIRNVGGFLSYKKTGDTSLFAVALPKLEVEE